MNTRRNFLIALGAGTLAAPLAGLAQQPAKVWRIGFLVPSMPELNPGDPDPYGEAFTREMKAAGHKMWTDYPACFGRRILRCRADKFPYRHAEQTKHRLPVARFNDQRGIR